MRIAVFDHQRKARHLAGLLADAGHTIVGRLPVDVLLVDHDSAPPRRQMIDACHADGGRVIMYPHGARPNFQYHGIIDPDPRVAAQLVHGPGLADIYARMGLPFPSVPVGWTYSPVVPFHAPPRLRRILFAPHHPFGDGRIPAEERGLNTAVAFELSHLDVEVTVQLYGSAAVNGIPEVDGWRYAQSDLNLDWRAIDWADAVVADGTLAYLAVARGKPTVMIGNDRQVYADDMLTPVADWDGWASLFRYPLDATFGPLADQLELARAGSDEVDEWAARMVGGPLRLGAVEDALMALVEVAA